ANFGLVELKIRRWERLLRYVALVEAGGEEFPLDPTSAFSSLLPSVSVVSSSEPKTPLVPTLEHLYFSEIYHLKSSIALQALDRLLASQSILPHQFFFDFLMRQYIPMLAKKREPPNTERFWKKLLFQVTLRYISHWNRRPANTAGGRQRLRLKEKKKKVWGVAALGLCVEGEDNVVQVNPQDHDALTQVEETLLSFRSAFLSGTGCPQLTLAFVVQLQRKGSSMDFFNFHLDLLSLQPPASLASSLSLPRAVAFQKMKSNFSFFFRAKTSHEEREEGARGRDKDGRRKALAAGVFSKRKETADRNGGEDRHPSFFQADLAGLAAVNLWEAYEICRLRQQSGADLLSAAQESRPLSSWEAVVHRTFFSTLKRPASSSVGASLAVSNISRSFPWDVTQLCEFFSRLVFAFCGVSASPSRREDVKGEGEKKSDSWKTGGQLGMNRGEEHQANSEEDAPQEDQSMNPLLKTRHVKQEDELQHGLQKPCSSSLSSLSSSLSPPLLSSSLSLASSLLVSWLSGVPGASPSQLSPSPALLSSAFSLLLPEARDAASLLLLAPSVSALLYLPQRVFDPVDVVGRDGNFILGFGYSGETPAVFNAGRGGLWAATRAAFKLLQRKAERERAALTPSREGDSALTQTVGGDAEGEDERPLAGAVGKRRRCGDGGDELELLTNAETAAGDARLDASPSEASGWAEEMTEEKFALACVDSEAVPPTLPVVTTGGLPYWALLLHQREVLSQLRFRLLSHASHSPAPGDGAAASVFSPAFFAASRASDRSLLCPANLGSLLCASVGYEKYWLPAVCIQIVEDDGVRTSIVRLREGVLPLRFALDPRAERGRKKVALRGDRVVHGTSSNKLMMKAADAAAAATDAPAAAAAAASGLSAVEGVAPGGAGACAAGPAGPGAPPAAGGGGGGFTSSDQVRFTGELSASDRGLIEALKRCVVAKHPSLLSLDNRSLVAKVNSKTKLPVLWLRTDPMQVWIGRIRRCQSGSMWEQQLFNDVSISSQLEAASALGRLRPGEDVLGTLSDSGTRVGAGSASPEDSAHAAFLAAGDCLARDAVHALGRALAFHRWHPLLRSRVVYALCFLHNRVRSEQLSVWTSLVSYMHTFHYDNLGDDDRVQHAAARASLLGSEASVLHRSVSPLASPSGDESRVCGDASGVHATASGPATQESGGGFFRIAEVAASTPEMRFLRHFYAAVSLLRDPEGLTRPEAIEMLLQPLVSANIGGSSPDQVSVHQTSRGADKEMKEEETDAAFSSGKEEKPDGHGKSKTRKEEGTVAGKTAAVDLLCFIASVVDCFGNIKCPYTPYPAYAETRHPYFGFLSEGESRSLSLQTPATFAPVHRHETASGGKDESQESSRTDPPAHASPASAPGCKCSDLTFGALFSAFASSRTCENHAFSSDAQWEAFVTRNARGVEAAWLNLWRLFRLDSVPALASPRYAISCAFLRVLSRQPTLRDLARRRFLRVASPSSCKTNFVSHLLSLLGAKSRPESSEATNERDCVRGEEDADDEEGAEEQTPFDFLIFVPLRTHDQYLRENAYSAYELHYAYHDVAVHREAIRAQLLVCCEGALRVYRVPLSSRRGSNPFSTSGEALGHSEHRRQDDAAGVIDRDGSEERWLQMDREIRKQRRNLGGLTEPYTLVSKFVSPEEQAKRAQLGLGIYTAMQCAVEMERLLRPDEARLPITIWEVFLDVLEELRIRNPVLFLPFATHIVELHSGTGLGQNPSESSPSASGLSGSSASATSASFCSGSSGMRPAFCRLLGCLGPCCSPLIPALPLPAPLLFSPSDAAAAASTSVRHQQQVHLQDHAISVALTVSQAASAYLTCYLTSEAQAAATGNRAAFSQKLCYAQNVYAFLFGVDIPFCCHPGAVLLARQAVSPVAQHGCSAESRCGHKSDSAARTHSFSVEGTSPLWSDALRPGAAAGAAAFCLTPPPDDGVRGAMPPEILIRLAGAGELRSVEEEAAAEYDLCLKAGSRQRKMWTFKRKYMDNAQHTAHWVDVAIEAVGALMEMPEAVWFIPDPETTVNEYRAVIQEPMWLKKVQAKLKAGLYKLPYHFKQDVALIFRNARTFNRPEDRPYRDCCVVEQKFNRLWGCINQAFQRAAAKSRRTATDGAHARQSPPVSSSAPGESSSTVSAASYLQSQVYVQPQMSYEQQLLSTLPAAGISVGGMGAQPTAERLEQAARGNATLGAPAAFYESPIDSQGTGPYNGHHEWKAGEGIQAGFMPAMQQAHQPGNRGHME
ncbi:bromodomain-containing protein, partial [Toxoplasma gondii ARI]